MYIMAGIMLQKATFREKESVWKRRNCGEALPVLWGISREMLQVITQLY